MQLARAIHSDASRRGITMVLLTSSGQRGSPAEAAAAGIDGYLTKPIRDGQLRDLLLRVLGRREESPAQAARSAATTDVRNGCVLLVEDNAVNQKVATHMLRRLGYAVEIARDGQQALDRLAEGTFDAVLMDCQMPVLDGHEATREVRRRERGGRRTPIIAMTAAAMAGDRERCVLAGMDDHVAKPVRSGHLAAVLRRWVAAPEVVLSDAPVGAAK